MSSKTHGKNTSVIAEVTGIGKNGLWLIYESKEYYIPFEDYPAFQNATVKDIYTVQSTVAGQLRWKTLDCDIELAALETPERFPLVYVK